MKVTLPDFRQASVLVVGDIMLDKYCYGQTIRISPEAPVPVVKINTIENRPGGAANVAINIASLGCCSNLVGFTGIDNAANILKELLNKANVACDLVTINDHPTITKLRVMSRNQQLMRLDFEQEFNVIYSSQILNRIKLLLSKINVLVLSDYAKGTLSCIRDIITMANKAGIPVLVDPKGSDFSCYRGATLLTPNLSEFESVVGICTNEEMLLNNSIKIITDYQLTALLITRSEHGLTLIQPGKNPIYLPSQTHKVYDVTGAGDTIISVLAAGLAAGNNIEESCFLANIAAGIVIGKLGTSAINVIELENAIHRRTEVKLKIITENQLKRIIMLSQQRGEKIVMTNGIFDILHVGHINYLVEARKLGDKLIVAVNSDDSAKRLKGEDRPFNSLMERMLVLASLEAVDWVVSFTEDTPQRLISNVLPDILIKGGDYHPSKIAGSKEIWDNGGEVLVLNFEEGYSSTAMINNIKKNNLF